MSSDKAARRARFEGVFDVIREELIAHAKTEGLPAEAIKWYEDNLNYNAPGGKLNRGISVTDTVEILKGRPLTEDEYVKAAILGWCVELLQAFFLVSDDIMDSSITRRGQPCWYLSPSPQVITSAGTSYKHPDVGMIAINDAFMLEAAIYHLLRSHFRDQTYYVDLLELFHDITYKTEMGQLVDLITAPEGVVDLNRFSLERHSTIVILKTAWYSFQLPVVLAMRVAGVPDVYNIKTPSGESKTIKPYDVAAEILIPLGEYFQVQDDYLDYSAPPEVLGKIGTDIVDNKCSWCINTVLKVCTPEQRKTLERNYARKGDIEAGAPGSENDQKAAGGSDAGGLCEKRVKEIYAAVGLPKLYSEYEEGIVKKLNGAIAAIPEEGVITDDKGNQLDNTRGLKQKVFTSFLSKIYGRSK